MVSLIDNFMINTLPVIVFTVLIVFVGYWVSKLLIKLLKKILIKSKVDYTVVTFITSIVKVLLYFVVIIAALAEVGINVTSIITALGAGLVTAGLAMQSTLSNLASGVVIIINKPIKAGDIIEFEGLKGRVEQVKLFYTTLVSIDNHVITIPNSRLTENNVVNLSTADNRRLNLSYTISYEDDITKVKGILYTYISTLDNIMEDPAPSVYVGEHKASGVEIVVHLWVTDEDYWDVYYHMQEKVKELFDENGITIPLEQIVVRKHENK